MSRKDDHEGIKNTRIMKEIFEESADLKIVCLIVKELLRVYDLNRPFTGGIGSYILVIMVHNILKMNSMPISGNYLRFILFLTDFIA